MSGFDLGVLKLDIKPFIAGMTAVEKSLRRNENLLRGNFNGAVNNLENRLNAAGRQFGVFGQGALSAAQKTQVVRQHLEDLFKTLYRFGSAFRQAGQAVFSFAAVLSILAVPKVREGLSALTQVTLDYQDALVATTKTAGLFFNAQEEMAATGKNLGKNMDVLNSGLKELSTRIAIPIEELAKMSTVAGQLGASTTKEILGLVEVSAIFAATTGMNAESAVLALGKIQVAYGDTADKGGKSLMALANTINMLENVTAASAREIVDGMLEAAGSAAQIGIAEDHLASLVATLINAGLSAAEAGTAVRRFADQLASNSDKIAKALGMTQKELLNLLDTTDGAVKVLVSLSEALNNVGSNSEAAKILSDIFEIRGAKTIQRFNADLVRSVELLGLSRKEYQSGNSAIVEYERSLESLKNQWVLLTNAAKVAGLGLTESLVPFASTIMAHLVPAVQMLGQWLAALSDKTKLMIVGGAALFVTLVPLVTIIGALVFSVGLLFNAMINLLGAVGILGSTFAPIIAIAATLAYVFRDQLVNAIQQFLSNTKEAFSYLAEIAKEAYSWGANIVAMFAEGMANAVDAYIVPVIMYMIDIISSFLEGHSPPKEGPLKDIMKWGSSVFSAYLRGFTQADFGILDEVGAMIEQGLKNLVASDAMDEKTSLELLIQLREYVAGAIDDFNKTGKVSEELQQKLVSLFGEAGGEMFKLLKMQLEYNKALLDLEAIQKKRQELKRSFRNEARAIENNSNLTVQQKAILLAQLRARRNEKNAALDAEEAKKKSQIDSMKSSIEWQQKFVNALQKQDDVMMDLLGVIKKLASAMEDAAKKPKADRLDDLYEELKLNKELQAAYEAAGLDILPLLREELRIRENIAEEKKKRGLDISGDLAEITALQQKIDLIEEMRKKQKKAPKDPLGDIPTIGTGMDGIEKVGEKINNLGEGFANIAQTFVSFSGRVLEARKNVELFLAALSGDDMEKASTKAFGFPKKLEGTQEKIYEFGAKMHRAFMTVKNVYDTFVSVIGKVKGTIVTALTNVNSALAGSSGASEQIGKVTAAISRLFSVISGSGPHWDNLAPSEKIISIWTSMINAIKSFIKENALNIVSLASLGSALLLIFNGPLRAVYQAVGGVLIEGLQLIKFGLATGKLGILKTILDLVSSARVSLTGLLSTGLSLIGTSFSGIFAGISSGLMFLIRTIQIFGRDALGIFATIIKSSLTGILSSLKLGLGSLASTLLASAKGMFSGILTAIRSIASGGISGILSTLVGHLKTLFSGAWSGGGSVIKSVFGILFNVARTLLGLFGSNIIPMILNFVQLIGTQLVVPFVLVTAAVSTLAGVFSYLWNNMDKVISAGKAFVENFLVSLGLGSKTTEGFAINMGFFASKFDALKEAAMPIIGLFFTLGEVIAAFVVGALPQLGSIFGTVLRVIIDTFISLVDIIGEAIKIVGGLFTAIATGDWSSFWEGVSGLEEALVNLLANLGGSVFTLMYDIAVGIVNGISAVLENFGIDTSSVKDWLKSTFGFVMDFVDNIRTALASGKLVEYFSNIGAFLWEGLTNGLAGGWSGVLSFFGALWEELLKFVYVIFGIASPSKVFEDIGIWLIQGFINGVKSIHGAIITVFTNIVRGIINLIFAKFPNAALALLNIFDGVILPAIKGFSSFITDTLLPILGAIVVWFISKIPVAVEFLSNMWTNTIVPAFTEFIRLVTTYVIPALVELGKWLGDNLPGFFAALWSAYTTYLAFMFDLIWSVITKLIVPALMLFAGWLKDNLPKAGAALSNFFYTTVMPMLVKFKNFIVNTVIPTLLRMANWLGENIPIAAGKMSDFWNNTLLPAITKIVNIVKDKLIPYLIDLAGNTFDKVKNAITEGKKKWDIFWDATDRVIKIVNELITKTFVSLKTTFTEIGDAMQELRDDVVEYWEDIIESIEETIRKIKEFFGLNQQAATNANGATSGGPSTSNNNSGSGQSAPRHGGESSMAMIGAALTTQQQNLAQSKEELNQVKSAMIAAELKAMSADNNTNNRSVVVNINNPVVRSESDTTKIAKQVRRELAINRL